MSKAPNNRRFTLAKNFDPIATLASRVFQGDSKLTRCRSIDGRQVDF